MHVGGGRGAYHGHMIRGGQWEGILIVGTDGLTREGEC